MRIMAIDYGDARTGVALSDPTGFLAGQTFLIKSRKQEVVLEELAALVQRQGAQELVMGYPRNMDGTLGPRAEKYAAFARRLEEATGLPVFRFLGGAIDPYITCRIMHFKYFVSGAAGRMGWS